MSIEFIIITSTNIEFLDYSDGLHLTAEGNAIVHQEVVRVLSEAGLCAPEMPFDFPHHSEIDTKNPEKAFQIKCV